MRRIMLAALLATLPAAAQEPTACTAEQAGLAACLAGKLCRCDFARGGTLTGRPDGWRWDCGALRPACGPVPPAGSVMSPMPPEVLLYLPPAPATLSRPRR
jgi:hypothetical protein